MGWWGKFGTTLGFVQLLARGKLGYQLFVVGNNDQPAFDHLAVLGLQGSRWFGEQFVAWDGPSRLNLRSHDSLLAVWNLRGAKAFF